MSNFTLESIDKEIAENSKFVDSLKLHLKETIVGQDELIEKLIIAILANGHVFLEGVPGLAKTLVVKSLASLIDTQFQRIQFTPDLLPADILGTLIFNPKNAEFEIKKGPIFSNIILADEINRAPAKVQSALLEAMQERQITIGEETFTLNDPFLVMATQNPIEQEGTYPLPEAQVDRFMFKVLVDYPNADEELKILQNMSKINNDLNIKPVVTTEEILKARKIVDMIHVSENIEKYIVSIIMATRNPEMHGLKDLSQLISFGASPRASINMTIAAKALAFTKHRGYVIPEDVRNVGRAILRHRILLSYEAEAEEITTEEVISQIFQSIPTP